MAVSLAQSTVAQRLSAFNRDLGLTDAELGTILGASQRMVERWRAGIVAPGPATEGNIEHLNKIHNRLYYIFEVHDVLGWLRTSNEQLHWLSPVAALQSGQFDMVEEAIDRIGYRLFR